MIGLVGYIVGVASALGDAAQTLSHGRAEPLNQERPPIDPLRLVGMSRRARRRAWAKAGAKPTERSAFGLEGRLSGSLRPCRFCRGYEGCARCRARHGPGQRCVFCEPCGTRQKTNRTNTPICDGSGVRSSLDTDEETEKRQR